MHPTYYRGCWHVVSRCLFERYTHPKACSRSKAVYNPKAVIPHAASLHQACAHCAIFPTAASRRSLGRLSVPMWPVTLSGRLLIVDLVGRYLTNQLIRRGSILYHRSFSHHVMQHCALMRYYQPFPAAIPQYKAGYPRVTHPFATLTRQQAAWIPFDLHVLSTPPAFILSQNRTLHKKTFMKRTNM